MSNLGHNERSYRLDVIASDAREGLKRVDEGEEATIGGWLAYGLALNEGRALFAGDKEFGEWVAVSQLGTAADGSEIKRDDRAAAMWAAANADQFEEARQAGKARTIRGIHAKWKEIEAERAAEAKRQEEAERKAAAENVRSASDETEPAVDQDCSPGSGRQAGDVGASPAVDQIDTLPEPDQSQTGAEPEPEPAPDPYGYARLTEAALLDEANGLRAALDEEKAKRKAVEAERDDFKGKWREATEQDMGRALGNAQRQRDTAKGRVAELMTKVKRLEYRLKKIEGQEVTL